MDIRIPIKAERILIRINSYNFYRHDVRETVSHHACFYIVKPQFLVESSQIYCTRHARNANDQRQQESGAQNLRTTFRGSVSRLDDCRIKTCYQHSRSRIYIFCRVKKMLGSYVVSRVACSWSVQTKKAILDNIHISKSLLCK